jgi:hypothetical protein
MGIEEKKKVKVKVKQKKRKRKQKHMASNELHEGCASYK